MDSPARPDLPDEAGPRRRAADRLDGRALRRLPGLHGLRHRLPVRRAVRQADRGDPGAGRAATTAPPRRRLLRAAIFALFPYPRRLRLLRGPLRPTSAAGCSGWSAQRAAGPAAADAGRDGGARAAARRRRAALPERVAGRAARAGRRSACSPAACRARSSPASTRPPPGCSPLRAATSSSRAGRAAAGRCRVHNGRERGGAGASPAALDRRVRGGRRGARRGQRGRLRLVDEGVRASCWPTTRRTPSGPRRSPARCGTSPSCWPSSARWPPRHPLPMTRGVPRRLPPRARPGRPRPAARSCSRRSPAWSCARSPSRRSAAARPASTTCSTPSRPASSATARPRNVAGHRRRAAGHRQPRLPDAGGRRAAPRQGGPIALAHTVEVLDASLRGPSRRATWLRTTTGRPGTIARPRNRH